MPRACVIVLDAVGAGELPDAAEFGDEGSNTLANVARAVGGLDLPTLEALGFGNIEPLEGCAPQPGAPATAGRLFERSRGKDTTTGHWEMMGIVTPQAMPTYPYGFPDEVIDPFIHHKQARALVEGYDLLVVEDLQIANMLRRARPVPTPDKPGQFLPNGAAAKRGLSRSISDAGWGRFVSILRAKAEDAGRTLIEVDPRHTSDRCEACGHAAPENRVTQAAFKCQQCGHSAQADEHAARNLLRAGLARRAQAA